MHQLQRIYVRRPWIGTHQVRRSLFNLYRPCFQTHHHLRTNPAKQYSTTPEAPFKIPPTQLGNKPHPLGWEGIRAQVEPYFDINWKFASEKEKNGFFSLGLSRAFSNSFPLTLDEGVGLTCKMFYFSLLIDDQLEKMSFAQMLSYRHRITEIVLGAVRPNISSSHEWMLYDTLQTMRRINKTLANDVARGFCQLLKAMTSQERSSISTIGPYLEFREIDVGKTLFTALMRFGANLHLTDAQLTRTKILESIAFRHASVINDIYSWDREWRVSQANATDGAQPFSAVYILAKERDLPFPACKELLWNYCRELEILFEDTRSEIGRDGHNELNPEFRTYLQGLEYFMSGIESWSQWTPRYRQ